MYKRSRCLAVVLICTIIISFIPILPASAQNPDQNTKVTGENQVESDSVPGEILVKFKSSADETEMGNAHKRAGAKKIGEIKRLKIHQVKIPDDMDINDAIAEYSKMSDVEYAEPNHYVYPQATVNDPYYPSQWNLSKIRASQAWDTANGSPVTVAVCDTGVDYNHEDLAGQVIKGYDFINNDNDPMDDNSHGTAVAGIIAGTANNSKGVAGIAYGAKILAIKVLSASGPGTDLTVANGITYAADNGAKVINLSLGSTSNSSTEASAVTYAQSKGCIIIASAGNDNSSGSYYPASHPDVIGVAATDSNDAKASFSNYGSYIDVAAPGVSVYTCSMGGGYKTFSGTSAAAPHVAAVTALMISSKPTLSAYDIRSKIVQSVDDLGTTGWDSYFGYGRINAEKAVVNSLNGLSRYEETNAGMVYTGTWSSYASTSLSGGSYKYSATTNSAATLTFSGTSITWLECKCNGYGIAKVYIDGVFDQDVDLYDPSSSVKFQQSVYTKAGLSAGTHTIKIVVSGTKNPASTGYCIGVDGFDVAVVPDTTPPDAPAGLAATAGDGQVALSWSAATDNVGVTGYNIYRSTTSGSGYSKLNGSALSVRTYTDSTALNGTTYYYVVKALDAAANESAASNQVQAAPVTDTQTPTAPTNLTAVAASTQINLSWSAATDNVGVTGYNVERSTDGATFSQLASSLSTSYADATAAKGVTYYYRVRAYDAKANASGYSNTASATMPNTIRYEETNAGMVYTGTWSSYASTSLSGGSYKYSATTNSAATLTFSGTSITWLECKCNGYGIAKVYIDGVFDQDVDLYDPSSSVKFQQSVYTKAGLSAGTHTIKIVVSGTKNPASTGYCIGVDGFDVGQ